MKLKYIIPALMAAVTMFTGCSDDDDATLNGISVSSSYVALNVNGGSSSISVDTKDSWTIEAGSIPSWLTVSPTSGSAGTSNISFSAESTLDGRTAEIVLTSGSESQRINVIQGLSQVAQVTCAEVIAGPDSKTYRVTGTVKSIANTTYGNWYIEDATGEVYIYGTRDKNGSNGANNSIAAWGIDVGDVLTIEGPKTTYNGTVELVDVTVISIKKSLVKIEEGGESALEADGGDVTVRLTVSGDGPYIDIDDEAKSWIGVTSVEKTDSTVNVGLHVANNPDGAARTGVVSFTSTNSSATSTVTATISQMGLAGTLENPFTVEDAIAYCQTLDGTSANDFYVKGKISRIISGGEFGSYGNATFYLSDDGEFLGADDKNPDLAHDFEAYRVLYFGNEKWAEGHANISVGDEVIICGKLTLYKGISETSSGNAYIYSINGVTDDANGVGNLAAPFNIAGAKAAIDNGVANDVFVKGIVSSIANNGEFGEQYGNGTFWISDDGSSNDFEAYRVLWLGNRKWTAGDDQIAVGDEVILHGQLTKYNTTYETASGKAYVYSVNGKTE